MSMGIRDKIQHLQLSILQDYLEIKLQERYGDSWINNIISHCEEKVRNNDQRKQTYKKVVDEKRTKGAIMVTKKTFDITLLNALLQFDFPNECCADPSDIQVFKNYIKDITNNKNDLASHISNLEDKIYIDKLERDSIYNLRNFILYLERLGWSTTDNKKRDFITKYKESIQQLDIELSGTKSIQKVSISIIVKSVSKSPIPGFELQMINSNKQVIAKWTSSNDPFLILVDVGDYEIESLRVPKGYKEISPMQIHASNQNDTDIFFIQAERSISNEEIFEEAFDCIAVPSKFDKCFSLLNQLEKSNYTDAVLLLAFLLYSGVCGKQDKDKARDLFMFAGFQEDESTWSNKADALRQKGKYKEAISYYMASGINNKNGKDFYEAGRIFLIKVKNYELCKYCFKCASESGMADAKKPYDFICKMSEEQYMKI